MFRNVAMGLGVALCFGSLSANAQTGYGVKPGAPSTSTFDRSWNRANESKDRARARASICAAAADTTIRVTPTVRSPLRSMSVGPSPCRPGLAVSTLPKRRGVSP